LLVLPLAAPIHYDSRVRDGIVPLPEWLLAAKQTIWTIFDVDLL
jgi:hypothetical protein